MYFPAVHSLKGWNKLSQGKPKWCQYCDCELRSVGSWNSPTYYKKSIFPVTPWKFKIWIQGPNYPLPFLIQGFSGIIKQMIKKEHNMVKNLNWLETNQLVIFQTWPRIWARHYREQIQLVVRAGFELWSGTRDNKSNALSTRLRCLPES